MMRILVTGASGLIGGALVKSLSIAKDISVSGVVRNLDTKLPNNVKPILVTNINAAQNWVEILKDVDVIVHCAARVHVMQEIAASPLESYRQANVVGTVNLAMQAAACGVKRLVFVSTVKVNGEKTLIDSPFFADDSTAPTDSYGISKAEAENALREIASNTNLEVVIVRPPLVYGPGVKANFLALLQALNNRTPLPFAGITANRRSLVALDNLVDCLITCITHPNAANQTFFVSDGEDMSTAQLLIRMGIALGKPARLIFVPLFLLKFVAKLARKTTQAQRLLGNLQVDISKTKEHLNWIPPISVDEGLRRAAESFKR